MSHLFTNYTSLGMRQPDLTMILPTVFEMMFLMMMMMMMMMFFCYGGYGGGIVLLVINQPTTSWLESAKTPSSLDHLKLHPSCITLTLFSSDVAASNSTFIRLKVQHDT